jgi:transcriptional regulator with XRE-family HTH domain
MEASAEFVAAIVGPRIRRIRRGQELSQEALADYAEIHRTQISLIEHAERLPRIDTVIRLAGGLLVPPCELLDSILWEPCGHRPGRMIEVQEDPDA